VNREGYFIKEDKMNEILEILEKDARTGPEDIARMLGITAKAVKSEIKKLEKDGVILKYKTIINKVAIFHYRSYKFIINFKIICQTFIF
jgi:DNA-binding Lrp family transcriptional regulator